MFNRVVWSQPDTLLRSIEAVRQCGLSVAVGLRWFDVDAPEDLDLLVRQPICPSTRRLVLRGSGQSSQILADALNLLTDGLAIRRIG